MPNNDKILISGADIPVAIGLLSRLPIRPIDANETRPIAASAWAWPLVGAGLALLAGLCGMIITAFGAGPGIAAGVTLAAMMLFTGALHEDGLADSADGLWGGHDTDRRLEIMKDSRIGTYGVLALSLSTLVRWSVLTALFQAGWLLAPLVAVGALSRVPMVVILAHLPNARGTGLAASTGQPEGQTVAIAAAISLLISLFFIGWDVFPALFWVAVVTLALAGLAKSKIGGQTGDILGASQQLAEIAILASLVASLT